MCEDLLDSPKNMLKRKGKKPPKKKHHLYITER